jgi:hypothetical protein
MFAYGYFDLQLYTLKTLWLILTRMGLNFNQIPS